MTSTLETSDRKNPNSVRRHVESDASTRHGTVDANLVGAASGVLVPRTVERARFDSAIDLALTDQVFDGSMPFVWSRYPDLPRDFSLPEDPVARMTMVRSMLPTDARIARSSDSLMSACIFAEGLDYSLTLDVSPSGGDITVASANLAKAQEVGESIAAWFDEDGESPDRSSVLAWRRSREGRPLTSTIDVPVPEWQEVAQNYPERTRSQLARLMELTMPAENAGRLILWHGAPGTGKTSALRALFRQWSAWCAPELVTDPEAAFGDPDYLFRLITRPPKATGPDDVEHWRLVVAEDADRYLQANQRLRDNPALDRLLNLTDGILGQGRRVLVLLTTNSDVATLSPALTRPGRCLAVTEFQRFDHSEAQLWLGAPPRRSGELTLAELFEERGDVRQFTEFVASDARTGQYL